MGVGPRPGIVDVFFTGQRTPLSPIPALTTLTLPPITVSSGQVVKLESFAWCFAQLNSTSDAYSASIQLRVIRNPDAIIVAESIQGVRKQPPVAFGVLRINPSLVWVDSPSPGTYTYSLRIDFEGENIKTDTNSQLVDRALIATLINNF